MSRPTGERGSTPDEALRAPGGPEDAESRHEIMWAAVTDLGARRGTPLQGSADEWWSGSERFWRHLAERPGEWWVAEMPNKGQLVGYARSMRRPGLLELTGFFVLPVEHSRGIGRALLKRAFPTAPGEVRSIVATTDVKALTRYYRAGTVARFPILTLAGQPRRTESGALTPVALGADDEHVEQVIEVERAVIDKRRPDHEVRWLLDTREGWVYRRDDEAVGYAFVGTRGAGPVAARDPMHLPEILLHVEARAHAIGVERLDFEVPGVNRAAIHHLLSRGFRLDPWVNVFMSDRAFGQFDRFVGCSPPLFL